MALSKPVICESEESHFAVTCGLLYITSSPVKMSAPFLFLDDSR